MTCKSFMEYSGMEHENHDMRIPYTYACDIRRGISIRERKSKCSYYVKQESETINKQNNMRMEHNK